MKNKVVSLLMVMLMGVSLIGCGTENPSLVKSAVVEKEAVDEGRTVNTTETTASSEITYPLTVVDMAGREVTIKEEPQRIVSGYYISSSACIALGLGNRIVAVEDKSDKRPIYRLSVPQFIDLPNVGSAKAFNLETCAAADPDLVILPMKQKDTAAALEEMGIPAILVMPESHEQILEMFRLIGTAANVMDTADELTKYYSDKLEEVMKLTAGIEDDEKPVVFIGGTGSYLTTAPAGMYQASLIAAAGGINAGNDIEGKSWTEISYEQLLIMNPDVIVIPTNNFATAAPEYTTDDILADPQLGEVTAVKNGAVYQMTIGFEAWDSPAPSGILGTLWMLKTLHPELYSSSQFIKDVQEFYQTFYGFTPEAGVLAD